MVLVSALVGLFCGCSRQDKNSKALAYKATSAGARDEAVVVPKERREQLAALGYATWDTIDAEGRNKVGVTMHRADAAQPGINYYCSESSGTIRFIDMKGELQHSVSIDVSDVPADRNKCKLAELDGRGGLVVLIEDARIVNVDFGSDVQWSRRGRFHHDVKVLPDGRVLTLSAREVAAPPQLRRHKTILDNAVVTVDLRGYVDGTLPLAQMVARVPPLLEKAIQHLDRTADRPLKHIDPRDLLHFNSIEAVRKETRYEGGMTFSEGDLLFCARYLDAIGVIDVEERRIKWHWGTRELQWPHHASLLPDGNILLFDNGIARGYSRILVVSPGSGRIVWSYQAEPPTAFFSRSRGAAQLLPNGNILITDSDQGRAFEVTRDGETVWEFWNPELNANETARATIYRMMRLSKGQVSASAMPEAVREKLERAIGP